MRILGGVENMSSYACPDCGRSHDLSARVPAPRSLWAALIVRLGDIPLDPAISEAGDTGRPLLVSQPDSVQAHASRRIATKLRSRLEA